MRLWLVSALCSATLLGACDPYGDACADLDGDGVYAACNTYDADIPGPDCNDDPADPGAADNWDSCETCEDADGDGHYVGCDQYQIHLGPDCNDTAGDPMAEANWESCETCGDDDGDGAFGGCDQYPEGMTEDSDDSAYDLLIVVEAGLSSQMASTLEQYRRDLLDQGIYSVQMDWSAGSAEALRGVLKEAHETYQLEGAFLIGDLPAAWYEQHAHGRFEQFPTDIFLQDFDTEWVDRNGNGVYDDHSDPAWTGYSLEVYVSRVTGTVAQMQDYFAKVHRYKTEGPLMEPSMFIFIDDDWQGHGFEQSTWGLESVYERYTRMENKATTTRDNYIQQIKNGGGEYVYQWIHSSPTTLYFEGYNHYQELDIHQISDMGATGSFFNLFDCSASRYTEPNLAATYLHETYGLATIGSTKPGGIYRPWVFHDVLADGGSWGEAYNRWYEADGVQDDSWFLGIVIMGDPTLTLSDETRRAMGATADTPVVLSEADLEALSETLFTIEYEVGTYEDYKRQHPKY